LSAMGDIAPPALPLRDGNADLNWVFYSRDGKRRGTWLLIGEELAQQVADFVSSNIHKASKVHSNYSPLHQYVPEKNPPALEANLVNVLKKGIRALGYNTENQDVTIKMAALSSDFHSLQDTHFDEDPAFNLRKTAADEPQNQVSFIFIMPASEDGMCILLYPEYDQTGVSGPSESVPVYVKQGELLLLRWDVAHAGTFAVLMNKRTPMIRLHGKAYIRGGRVPDVQPTNYYHDANGNELRQFYKVTEVVKNMFGPSTREAQSFGESVVTTLPEDFDGPPLDLFARPQLDIPSCLSSLKPNVSPSKKYVPFLTTQPSPNHGRPDTKSDRPLDGTGIGGSQIIFDNDEKHAPDTKHKCDQVSMPQVAWIF